MPASPTRLPRSCAGEVMCLEPSETIEVNGRWTMAPIATNGSPLSRASMSSGSYEMATSTLPAASS